MLQISNIALYYGLKGSDGYMEDSWLTRIRTKCPNSSNVPLENSFKGTLHSTLYAFIYFAQIFNARKFPRAFDYWYSSMGIKKLIIRTLIMLVLLGTCYIPFFTTMNASFNVQMWVGIFLTNTIVGVVAVPLLDLFTDKLKLYSMIPREDKYGDKEGIKVEV
eukprot:TRINITY_DN3939_c0_g1_i19.p1 TRINITY_DN3939_c0_g1~~TRINITY_DN3939_c0_g1_i19.p1  ORF type:complete len:162 (+),score=36.64 TRINITY_DN3939_c0_g1_i19:141-626(+)